MNDYAALIFSMYLGNCAIGIVSNHVRDVYLKWLHTFSIAQFLRYMHVTVYIYI